MSTGTQRYLLVVSKRQAYLWLQDQYEALEKPLTIPEFFAQHVEFCQKFKITEQSLKKESQRKKWTNRPRDVLRLSIEIQEKEEEIKQRILKQNASKFEQLVQNKLDLQNKLLVELSRIAFSDVRNLYDKKGFLKAPTDLDDDTAAVVAAVEYTQFGRKYKNWDKQKAIDVLAKYVGLLTPAEETQNESNMEKFLESLEKMEQQEDGD